MGSSLKTNVVRDLLKSEQPDLLLLQETKITEQEFQNHIKKKQKICRCSSKRSRRLRRDKASCWDTITSDLMTAQGGNIFLGGDLNLIRNADEKLGGNFYVDPSRDSLEAIIQTHNLVDIPPHNGRFTWSNKRIGNSNIKERLDQILVQERIVARFSNIQSKIILGYFSDHKPVALILDKGKNMGPLPFKYNKAWDSKEEFRTLVKEQWEKEVIGSPHFIWESKLENLRNVIKRWAKNHAVEESKKRADLQIKLEQWNQDKERTQFIEEDQAKENEMYRDLYKQHKEEEEEQRQKSRCLWLKAGDKNTSFFHNSLKLRHATNHIERIMIEGRELRDQDEIKEVSFNHFSALLTADPQPVDSEDFLSSIENKITVDQNNELDKGVTIEEIEWLIFSMAQDKAPGPDGFTVAFYRTHWETIKKDFVRMVKNFFSKRK
eukprot:PITA_30697